jgi:hypothetical protein
LTLSAAGLYSPLAHPDTRTVDGDLSRSRGPL